MPGRGGEEDEEDRKDVFLPSHRLPRVDLKLGDSLRELILCLPPGVLSLAAREPRKRPLSARMDSRACGSRCTQPSHLRLHQPHPSASKVHERFRVFTVRRGWGAHRAPGRRQHRADTQDRNSSLQTLRPPLLDPALRGAGGGGDRPGQLHFHEGAQGGLAGIGTGKIFTFHVMSI